MERETMEERRARTRVQLRNAVGWHGAKSQEARSAAISFCVAHGIDPHWRYALFPKISDAPVESELVPRDIPQITEWEVQIGRVEQDMCTVGQGAKEG